MDEIRNKYVIQVANSRLPFEALGPQILDIQVTYPADLVWREEDVGKRESFLMPQILMLGKSRSERS